MSIVSEAKRRCILNSVVPQIHFRFVLIVCICLQAWTQLSAATINWIATSASNYTNAAAWSGGTVPAGSDSAFIGNATVMAPGEVLYTNIPPALGSTNSLTQLVIGGVASSSGTFTMNAGTLSIANNGNCLILGNANPSSAQFTMNGGVLNLSRTTSPYNQDGLQVGMQSGSSATFTLNGGTANFLCGIELGSGGQGTLTVNGGTLMDNGWFGVGRGGTGTSGWSGTFNQTAGTVYLLRNPNTESGADGIAFCQAGTNGAVNISGGTLYCYLFRFEVGPGTGKTDTEALNISGGVIYVGGGGLYNATGGGTHNVAITLSGGTFHTVDLGPNTGGTQGLASVLADGTNWAWASNLPAVLNTGPGPGYVTFAPEPGRTIFLNGSFSGPGGVVCAGPGTVSMNASNSYTGLTSITGGTLAGNTTLQGTVTTMPGINLAPGTPSSFGSLVLGTNLTLNTVTNVLKLSANPFATGNGVNDLIAVQGDLTLQNISTIQIVPNAPLSPASPYTLFQYSGQLHGSLSNLRIVCNDPRYDIVFVDPSATPGSIQVVALSTPQNLIWRGNAASNPSAWDHGTTNWVNAATGRPDYFFDADSVVFDDTAALTGVTIADDVSPASITISNSATVYSFTGNGVLSGGLSKRGSGAATLSNLGMTALENIDITAGELQIAGTTGLGDPSATLTVETNSVLSFSTVPRAMNKSIYLVGGALIDCQGATTFLDGPIYLAGTNTFCTRADLHLRGSLSGPGSLVCTTNSLLGSGNGKLILENSNSYAGSTILGVGSTVGLLTNAALSGSANIILNAGSSLDTTALPIFGFSADQTVSGVGAILVQTLDFQKGSTLEPGLSSASIGNLTVNGNLILESGSVALLKISGNSSWDTVTGLSSITYGGALIVTNIGAGNLPAGTTFRLFNASSYAGSFSSFVLPPNGLPWDTSRLTVNGVLAVAQPQFSAIGRLADGSLQMAFDGPLGNAYTLWGATNLLTPITNWLLLSSGTITSNPMSIIDPNATNYPLRFYRISEP